MRLLTLLKRGTRWDSFADLAAIDTARLRIQPLAPNDAEAVCRLTDDPAVTGAVDFLPERFTIDDARGLVRSGAGGRDVFLGAWVHGSSTLVGIVGMHLRALEAVEIGYWVGGASRGRGYGIEAVGAVVRALSKRFPRRAIVAQCRPENVASWQLLHKLGFRPTGDAGHRPGRMLLVWEERQAPRAQPAVPSVALSKRPATGEERP